jgi:NAD(P)-dependent dehydrogenase (short-subunit alcohol dehydrogenase family)
MDLGLGGKTVVITGGTGGIGRGIVLEFAREGANVISADLDAESDLTDEAERLGLSGAVIEVKTDVSKRDSVDAMIEAAHHHFGPVDALVNNAGGNKRPGLLHEIDDEEFRRYNVALNMDGVMNCTLAAARDMFEAGKGSIVNISSNASVSGLSSRGVVHYAGMKGFVNSLGKGLAVEWAERGIRINTIAPGLIVPHASEHIRGTSSRWHREDLRGRAEDLGNDLDSPLFVNSGSLIRRVGRPEDIAYLAMFFVSDRSSYITGQLVSVSGGGYMP